MQETITIIYIFNSFGRKNIAQKLIATKLLIDTVNRFALLYILFWCTPLSQ